ncbi:MAG: DUF1295 domain-containing protein [Pseudomonadota bacterium]
MMELFWDAWVWSLLGFVLLWPLSVAWRDTSVVDFWWGPGFGAMALAAWAHAGQPTSSGALLVLGLIGLWSVRLGIQLGLRRLREGEEDARYREMRALRDPGFWWKSLFIIFLLQAVIQGLIGGSIVLIFPSAGTASALGWIAAFVALAAIVIQTISDTQLDVFKAHTPHGLLKTGLRRYVRYPSYLAEVVFWSALALLALDLGWFGGVLSAVIVGLLIRFVSGVTILDDRLARTRTEYPNYRAVTPALIPSLSPQTQDNPAE